MRHLIWAIPNNPELFLSLYFMITFTLTMEAEMLTNVL